MKEYTIIRRPEQLDWSVIPVLEIDTWQLTQPLPISAQAQICYDDQALYVHLSAVEQDIRAEHMGPLGEICEDSCLEFFFSPLAGDLRYFNLECNLNGAMFVGFGTGINNLVRLVEETPFLAPHPNRTDDGWEVTYEIPFTFIRLFFPNFAPTPGYSMRANCYKCGEFTVKPHYLTWNPVPEEGFTFHCPEHFGIMHFA